MREEPVWLWEAGRARPHARHYGRIVRFLGYDPLPAGSGVNHRFRAARLRRGLTQAELAFRLGLDEGTLVDLEAGRRRPSRRVSMALKAFCTDECRPGHEPAEQRFEQPKRESS